MDQAKNFAKVTVIDGNYDDTATDIEVITADGAKLPTPPFNAVWWNVTDYPDPSDDPNVEIVRVLDVVDDALNITRAQEGTAASEKNISGKSYQIIAGLTAASINDQILKVVRDGDVYSMIASGDVELLNENGGFKLTPSNSAAGIRAGVASGEVGLGDVDAVSGGQAIKVQDSIAQVSILGHLGSNQSASASVAVGTLAAKLPIYDETGTLLGYIPIYGSIT